MYGASSLLERAPALERVGAALRRSADGDPAVLVVRAPAGIGKTSLLDAACAACGPGITILRARPAEHERPFAYGVLRQLLGAPLRAVSPTELERLRDGPAGAALPALADDGAPPPPFDGSFGVVDGLYWLVAELAAREPLALVVDDAHWADAPSLRFLGHLLRRLHGLPVCVVVALRPDEPGAPSALLDPLELDPRADVVALRPLSREAVDVLVAREGYDDPALAAACHDASAGNPLYLRELLRTIAEDARTAQPIRLTEVDGPWPVTVARHVRRRAAALGGPAAELLEAMVVLGDGSRLSDAAAVAETDGAVARTLADGLRRMGVLAGADPVRFAHPVVRSSLRADQIPAADEARSRRAVEVLRRAGAPAEQVAGHLVRLPPGEGAPVDPLREAGRAALARGAPDASVAYLRRALAEPPAVAERPAVLHDLGVVEEMLGDDACWEHLEAALAAAPDPSTRATWAIELSVALAFRGRVPEALDVIETAHDGAGTPAADRERLAAHLCAISWGSADGHARSEAVLDAFVAHPPEDPGLARLVLSARAARLRGPAAEVGDAAERALAGDALLRSPWVGNIMATGTLVYADRFAAAGEHLDRVLELARAAGNESAIGAAHTMLADLAHATGDLAGCEALLLVQLGPLRGRTTAALAYATSILVRALVDRGALDRAEEALAELGDLSGMRNNHLGYFLRAARGRLRCAQGRLEDGVAELAAARACLTRFAGSTWSPIGFDGADAEPLALERLGREDEAQELVAASLPMARRDGPPRNRAATLRAAALLTRGSEGVVLAEEAVGALEGTGAQLELARCLVALGTLRRRAGGRAAAREDLARGHDLARDCGAEPLAAAARDELRASGTRPRRGRLISGPEALTPSELRLARLAAAGRTNREIAQELYLAQKTVEMHLSRTYQKLGIPGRGGLAGALGDRPG